MLGLKLDGGWEVRSQLLAEDGKTPGVFSWGYEVSHADGRHAFLKAFDYSVAFADVANVAEKIGLMSQVYLFEKNLCEKCRGRSMSRVVRMLEAGAVRVDPSDPFSVVQYLVFELSDGDIRHKLDAGIELAWSLRTLHHVATGLQQLHLAEIAHQDLKPANVLTFSTGSKIGDLGRAIDRNNTAPHEHCGFAGDQNYAPPECDYESNSLDWIERRIGADLYLFGSMIAFVYGRVTARALLRAHTAPAHRSENWLGTFEEVLPHLVAAHECAMEQLKSSIPAVVRNDLTSIVGELCHPNPKERGNPRSFSKQPIARLAMARYITRLDVLAKKAEFGLWGGK